jgi:hypothetical protein
MVFPGTTATLTGADNRHLPETAHVHMAFQPDVFDEVCRWLEFPAGSVKVAPCSNTFEQEQRGGL